MRFPALMKRRRVAHGRAALCLAAVALLTSGCENHRRLIAARTLFDANGRLDLPAYSAALTAKFPPGAPISDLESYVRSVKGGCHRATAAQVSCEATISGTICIASLVRIEALVDGEKVKSMQVSASDLTC